MAETRPQRSEERDASLRLVATVAAVFVLFLALSTLALFYFYRQPDGGLGDAVAPTAAIVAVTSQRRQRLDFERDEALALRSYGWIDRSAGRVHIPVEEAMRMLAERGRADPWPEPEAAP